MKRLIFSLIFVFVIGLGFMSCSKTGDGLDYQTYSKNQFTEKFEKTFGTPAADQDWGFNEQIKVFDYTQHAATRGHNVNRNQWYDQYNVPPNVTVEEEQAVLNKLAEGSGNRDSKMIYNWSDFFVYHVHKGTDTYNDHAGQSIGVASDHMNHLQAVFPNGDYDHINDFNSGQQNANWWTIEGATLMVNSSTSDFAYHNSTDSKYHNNYTVIDGSTIGYPGFYYICFDFLANGDIEQPANKNMGVDRNYNYTDWIVRISPATFNMSGAVRIIAEDLGKADDSDFDYNDVVFDAKVANVWVGEKNDNRLIAYIRLQAAGGTLPLTVGGVEVHNKFGVAISDMVNTGIVSRPTVDYQVDLGPADWNISGADAVKSIPIVVKNGNRILSLGCETGQAPEKIAVPITFQWCSERTPIQSVYPLFSDWVLNKSVVWN